MTTTIKFHVSELTDNGRMLLDACRQQSVHYAAILQPNAAGITYVDIHDRRDSDDVIRIRVKSRLSWSDRAKRFGVMGLDASQVARDEHGAPILVNARDNAYLPTDDYIASVEDAWGSEAGMTHTFEVPYELVQQVRSGDLSDADAWNAIGDALNQFCTDGAYAIHMSDNWITQQEAALRKGLPATTIYGAVQRGKLRTYHNPHTANPQQGGTLVWWPEADALWGSK